MTNCSVIDTVRWKAVKFQHKLTDDMKVAKILLDCYDVIISGCLQWENNKKRNKLPPNSTENGWDLLEDILCMMKKCDTEEKCKVLTMRSDDIEDDFQDQGGIVQTRDFNNVTDLRDHKKLVGQNKDVRPQKEDVDQKGEIKHQDEISNFKGKSYTKTGNENDKETAYDNQIVDISIVKCGNGYRNDMNTEDKSCIVSDEACVKNEESGDETAEDLDKDDGDGDWVPSQEKCKQDTSKRNPILLKRKRRRDHYPDSYLNEGNVAKVKRKCTRTVEFLTLPNVTKVIECKICVHTVDSVDEFRKHFATNHSQVLVGEKVTKTDILQLKRVPKLANIYTPCPECNELIPPIRLETHRIRNHFQRTCELCGVFFTTFSGWNNHQRSHKAKETGSNPYVCEICGKAFTLPGPLTEHRKRHVSYRSHICEVCGKGFKYKYEVRKHKLRSHGDKLLTCEFCGKTFRCKYNLKTHLRVHTNERPYLCSLCGKSYSHNSSLKSHSKSEHGIEMGNLCQRLQEVDALPSKSVSHNSILEFGKSKNKIELGNQCQTPQNVDHPPESSMCEPKLT